jgi:dipeptidyl-peptidase-4
MKKSFPVAMVFAGARQQNIAYWQIDANKIRDYYMLNTTDSVYSKVIPVEYPKVGEPPSPARIGVSKYYNRTNKVDESYG